VSRASDGVVKWGKWLPDLPAIDNPGLTEALNVLPVAGSYRPYRPLSTQAGALASRPLGAISVRDTDGNAALYAGTATDLYQRSGATWTDRSTAVAYTTSSLDFWRFAQFDNFVIGTNYADLPQKLVIASSADFEDIADTGTAPRARVIGVIGRFVVLGHTNEGVNGVVPSRLQWCAIDDCTDWPIPQTADARTKQAGEQFMQAALGPVLAIEGEEQFGIVFQRSGISRVTYVGGDVVFQFDNIDSSRGLLCPNGVATVGKRRYFPSSEGFFVTDGVNVEPIGDLQVDQFFLTNLDSAFPDRVYAAVDRQKKIIYFAFPGPSNTGGRPNMLLVYNYLEQRWTHCEQILELLVPGLTIATSIDDFDDLFDSVDDITPPLDSPFWAGGAAALFGFDTSFQVGTLAGTPGTARIDGQEVELNLGLYSYVGGIKPLVTGDSSVDVTIALGSRDNLDDAVSYTAATDRTATTGYCDFENESRYHRARMEIVGEFKEAVGVQFIAQAAGT
jgi:hypothetical protein